jgi:hypothetical protein
MKKTEFDNFTDHLYDVVFQETANYVSDCIGSDDWGEELHETHGIIMYNAIEALAKTMKIL